MEGPISFWGIYKEQESNLILPEHGGDDDDYDEYLIFQIYLKKKY